MAPQPSKKKLSRTLIICNLSAHLCGAHSANVLTKPRTTVDGLIKGRFSRAQINSAAADIDSGKVREWAETVRVAPILQCRGEFPQDENVAWLFDDGHEDRSCRGRNHTARGA